MTKQTETTTSTNEHGLEMRAELDWEVFSPPSGNVAGYVTMHVTMVHGKKPKLKRVRVGHAYLNTNEAPNISFGMPTTATPAEVDFLAHALLRFADKVRALDAPRQQVERTSQTTV